jgi:hypothetical protein
MECIGKRRISWHNRRRYEIECRELKDLLATRIFIGMNAIG